MRRLPAIVVLAVVACALSSTPGLARHNPTVPLMGPGGGPPGGPAPSSQATPFQCGTWRGNQIQNVRMRGIDAETRRASRTRAVSAAPTADYVYDDVWVVEDDGTLTLSGLNLFDTDNRTFHFSPTVSGYDVDSVAFNYDASLGTPIAPGDDGNVDVSMSFSFPFADTSWTDVYVNGNGIVAFGQIVNPSGYFDNNDFFSTVPKISPYFMDLNPAAGGGVYEKAEPTKTTITWSAVPEYGTSNFNTMQLVLYDDGSFDVTFDGIASTSQANGAPITFGFNPGGSASLDVISFSDDLPYHGGAGSGIYESYLDLTTPVVDEIALFKRFYQTYPDSFFQLIYFTNFTQTMSGFANELNIKNDVTGIAEGIFDYSGQYGSNGVLESRCDMNQVSVWPDDPTSRVFGKQNNYLTIQGQESAHRWGAFVNFQDSTGSASDLILGRSDAHWSYYLDNDHSSLEGGDWNFVSGDTYVCPSMVDYYHPIDHYLFGLRTPEEVAPTFYLGSPTNDLSANRSQGTPVQGATAQGTPVPVTIQSIIAVEGPRTPSATNNTHKDLRQAFIFLVANGTTPTQAELDRIANYRRAWEDYFEKSCDGRLTCNTSLTQNFPVAVIGGLVTNKLTDQTVPDFTATSVERDFVQPVPAGGHYTFRYLANATSGPSEGVTIVFAAPGYYPDTLATSLAYGTTTTQNIALIPVPTAIQPGVRIPNALYPAVPNPFNPTTRIRYDLADAGTVHLDVYDIAGRRVRTLVDGHRGAGPHEVIWDGRNDAGRVVATGVYIYRLEAGHYVSSRKMVLLK